MPPGPAYNWLCVLNSTIEIISHAAQYKAAQVAPKAIGSCIRPRKRRRTGDFADAQENDVEGMPRDGPSAVKFERPQLGLQREHAAQSIVNDLKSVQEKLVSVTSPYWYLEALILLNRKVFRFLLLCGKGRPTTMPHLFHFRFEVMRSTRRLPRTSLVIPQQTLRMSMRS